MSDQRKASKIDIDDLMYYFDGQEKDSLDNGKIARKVGQVLTLRNKLLALSQEEFDQTIAAIEKLIVSGPQDSNPNPREIRSQRQKQALELFEKANVATPKVTQVSKV